MPVVLSNELLLRYLDFIYERYGIHYSRDKKDILRIKLEKLASAKNYSLAVFFDRLLAGDTVAFDELLHEITVGHTFFFREKEHLHIIVDDIREKKMWCPTIWCAASSSGEEPYSIAIFLLDNGIEDFTIISSDVNLSALKMVDRGLYHVNKLQAVTPIQLKLYFNRIDDFSYKIKPQLRRYLKIKRINLHAEINFEEQFDFILCRNVMIYFDDAGRQKVVSNLVKNLKTKGILFVGHTEALLQLPPGMKKEGPAIFRKVY